MAAMSERSYDDYDAYEVARIDREYWNDRYEWDTVEDEDDDV